MNSPIRDPFTSSAMDTLLKCMPAASKINIFNLYGAYLGLNLAAQDRIVIANTNRYVVF